MASNQDNSGCFLTIAIFAGVILIIYILGEGCKELNHQMKKNPEDVMSVVFVIGLIAFIIYWLMKEQEPKK